MGSAEDTMGDRSSRPVWAGPLAIRAAFLIGSLFLLVGVGLAALAAAQLVRPDLGAGTAMLSYGRVFPAAGGALVFGWLTLALIGIAFHAVPRLVGAPLAFPLAGLGLVLLTAAGAAGGTGLVLLGENAGGRWTEFPLIVDGVVATAAAGVAGVLWLTARGGTRDRIPLAAWYLIAAPIWFFLAYASGAVPGLDGLGGEIQAAFSGTAVFALWLATGGIGAAYVTVSLAVPDATFHERLGRIGFWSLALTWVFTSGRLLQFGPTPDWIETIPVVFAIGAVVAVVTIATDFAHALRGRITTGTARSAVLMALTGLGFLLAATLVGFVGSLRSASAVVRFTAWEAGLEHLVILGGATLLVLSAIVMVVDRRPWGAGWARAALWPIGIGAGVAAVSRFLGGLQQGYGWLAGVHSKGYDNFGPGFERSSDLSVANTLQVAGLALVAFGALVFVARLAMMLGASGEAAPAATGPTTDLRRLTRRAVLAFALAAAVTFVLPAIDSQASPSLLADRSRTLSGDAEIGRQLYVSEGCWYCHTQQVRAIVTDVGLGPASVLGDYAYDPVGVAGWARLGPDLAHQGSREVIGTAVWIYDRLVDPRREAPWSVMPSYGHLSDADLVSLSLYVAGLE